MQGSRSKIPSINCKHVNYSLPPGENPIAVNDDDDDDDDDDNNNNNNNNIKSRPYTYDVKFLTLLGAIYVYTTLVG
jgi:hypothetical protein